MSKVTRVAIIFPPLVRPVDGNPSAAAIPSAFLPDQVMLVRTGGDCSTPSSRATVSPGLVRDVDRHLPTAATPGVPLFDRRHAG
jgi:hypothetical protein